MSEYPREYPEVHNILHQQRNSVNDPHVALTSWLEELDISSYDFPYLEPLIRAGFTNWIKDALPMSGYEKLDWLIADHEGRIIQRSELAAFDQEKDEAAKMAIQQCVVLGELGTAHRGKTSATAVPVRTKRTGEIFAIIVCSGEPMQDSKAIVVLSAKHFQTCFYRNFENLFVTDLLILRKQASKEAQRRTALFQAVQRMHDKIDVDSVLNEVFDIVSEMYPGSSTELLMSQDHPSQDSRIRLLQLQDENERDRLCVKSFLEISMLRQDFEGEDGEARTTELAIPLSGKQGVYGAFRIVVPHDKADEIDMQLLEILADTAGTAFENAKLYEQSNVLIHELRLINELARQLNQSLRLEEVFKFATDELLHIFKAEYCLLTQFEPENGEFKVIASNVSLLSNRSFPSAYGFSGLVLSTQEPVILSDYQNSGTLRSVFMEETGSRSMIAAPVIVRGKVSGTILIAHRSPQFFSYENYKLLQVLASHIGLAIANASLHAEVQVMANRDMLTGLYARHYLDKAIQQRQQKDESGSLIIVDIDYFKQVNDSFGHQSGDRILKQVCEIIRSTIRGNDIAARWGGEELAIYLPGIVAEDGAKVADRIRNCVYALTNPKVTVSCGVADWKATDSKFSVEGLFYRADMALYRAKNTGRNRVEVGDRA